MFCETNVVFFYIVAFLFLKEKPIFLFLIILRHTKKARIKNNKNNAITNKLFLFFSEFKIENPLMLLRIGASSLTKERYFLKSIIKISSSFRFLSTGILVPKIFSELAERK